jgi:hypothetical protein
VSCISFPSMLMTTIDDGNVRVWGPSDCVGSIDRSIDREQSKERWIIDLIIFISQIRTDVLTPALSLSNPSHQFNLISCLPLNVS